MAAITEKLYNTLGENFTYEDYVNLTNGRKSQHHWFPLEIELPLIIIYCLLMIFGVGSNALVCYIVLKLKQLRTTRNLLIVNLSISDIVMSIFCVPFTLLKLILKDWPLGDILCRLVPWLQAASVFASTMTIAAIALDRYKTIVKPSLFQESQSRNSIMLTVIGIWLVSAVVGLPLILYSHVEYKQLLPDIGFNICLEEWPSSLTRSFYAAIVMLIQFIAPIVMLLVLHWKICSYLKYCIQIQPSTSAELLRAMKHAKRHRKNTSLLIAIAVMFALCWFPLTLLNFLADFNYSLFMFRNFLLAFALAHIIAMISACLNPILYGWFNSNFRKEFTQIVLFWRKDDKSERQKTRKREEIMEDDLVEHKAFEKIDAPEGAQVVYKTNISYKAIQTEVQPKRRTNKSYSTPHINYSPTIGAKPNIPR